ncbi:MAG: dihydroorotate dehydrogenase-like protein, partial [Deltaproteobacteria bacterium]
MADLSTGYLGMELDCPLVVAASPLSRDLGSVRRLEDAGAGAIVLFSVFQEQFEPLPDLLDPQASSAELVRGDFLTRPHEYLELVSAAAAALRIPVIPSINVAHAGHWLDFVPHLEQAGARALELSIYQVSDDPYVASAALEAAVVELVEEVRGRTGMPLAVKISPYLTSLVHAATGIWQAGAAGLVLFQRFCQPDVDIERCRLLTDLELSVPAEVSLRIGGLLELYGRVGCSLAASGGVHDAEQALACILAGADAVMLCSALLEHGPEYLADVRRGLEEWLE